jgi:hypothetical protein
LATQLQDLRSSIIKEVFNLLSFFLVSIKFHP